MRQASGPFGIGSAAHQSRDRLFDFTQKIPTEPVDQNFYTTNNLNNFSKVSQYPQLL